MYAVTDTSVIDSTNDVAVCAMHSSKEEAIGHALGHAEVAGIAYMQETGNDGKLFRETVVTTSLNPEF